MTDLEKCCVTASDVGASGAHVISCSFGGKREGQPAKEKTPLLGCHLSFQATGIILSSSTQTLQPEKTAHDQTAFVFLKVSKVEKDGQHVSFSPVLDLRSLEEI